MHAPPAGAALRSEAFPESRTGLADGRQHARHQDCSHSAKVGAGARDDVQGFSSQ
jgi:hypothetical protein